MTDERKLPVCELCGKIIGVPEEKARRMGINDFRKRMAEASAEKAALRRQLAAERERAEMLETENIRLRNEVLNPRCIRGAVGDDNCWCRESRARTVADRDRLQAENERLREEIAALKRTHPRFVKVHDVEAYYREEEAHAAAKEKA